MRGREEGELQAQIDSNILPDDLLDQVFNLLTSDQDRNNISLVCKSWYKAEAQSRRRVFIGNCYSITPTRLINRFPNLFSATIKGKPRFADFDLLPMNWGARAYPWIDAFCKSYPLLEELKLKRMTVCDASLQRIATSFPHFKRLTLITCDGFGSVGLSFIARNCKVLESLDLIENKVENLNGSWILDFPSTFTSLVSLNLENIQGEVNTESLAGLIGRCSNLKSLKLNSSVSLTDMLMLLHRTPNLIDLGTGSFSQDITPEGLLRLQSCITNYTNLTSLSGFWEVRPGSLCCVYPVCKNLTSLNLSYTPVDDRDLGEIVGHCCKLQRLWIMDTVEDRGLKAIASSCRDLKHLRVYPGGQEGVSEEGLISISEGCPNLISILYFCGRMTNNAIMTMAENCRLLESFRLATLDASMPDPTTNEPLDEGFGAIVKNCKCLRRLALSGLLTDRVFEYIGNFGKTLQRLSIAFAGGSDIGLQYVLRGCINLFKLEIRDSPFGDDALLMGTDRYESMRSLWMSNCRVTMQGCMTLAIQKRDQLAVEVMKVDGTEDLVESVYVYRSVSGHRNDMPPSVMIL